MKILKLKALNINSLTGKTEINFEEILKRGSLFAITGPTGAGKSTILDVITCALYGKTARLKNPNSLMSAHHGEAMCEVLFEVKGEIYRSSWSQKRARLKHDGNFQTAKMELADFDDKILQTGFKVPKFIEELTGLDFERFTKSMMLAQGSFDAFLKAKQSDRSVLLEKITGTKIYAKISQTVYEKYSFHKNDILLDERDLENIDLLDEEILRQKEEIFSANKKIKDKTKEELEELNLAIVWIKTLDKLKEDLKKTGIEFDKIRELKKEKKEDFTKLNLANKALNVTEIFTKKVELKRADEQHKKSLKNLTKELEDAKKLIDADSELLNTSKKELSTANIEFEIELKKLKNARVIQTKKVELEKIFSELKKDIDIAKKQKATLTKNLKSIDAKKDSTNEQFCKSENFLKIIKQEIEVLEKDIENLNKNHIDSYETSNLDDENELMYQKEVKELEALFASSKEHKKLIEKKELLQNDIKIDSEKLTITLREIEIKKQHIDELKILIDTLQNKKEQELLIQKYEEDREKLEDGKECFLCGSKKHPFAKKEVITTHKTVALIKEYLEKLKKKESELKVLEKDETTFKTKTQSYSKELSKLTLHLEEFFNLKDVDSIKEKLDFANKSIDLIRQRRSEKRELAKQKESKNTILQKKLKEKKQSYQTCLDSVNTLEKQMQDLKISKKECEIKILSLKNESCKKDEKFALMQSELKQLEEKRVNTLNVVNLDYYEEQIKDRFLNTQTKQRLIEDRLSELKTKNIEKTKQIKSIEKEISILKIEISKATNEFEKQLKHNSFKSIKEFEDARLDSDKREKLSLFCKKIEDKFNKFSALKTEVNKQLDEHKKEPKSEKSLNELEIKESVLKQKVEELQIKIGSDEKELELNNKNQTKYKNKIQLLKNKREDFSIWVKLQELIGSNDGSKFSKFAQGITLDQLIHLANRHLKILTPRYSLIRSKDEKQLLEIEVIDAFQANINRLVNTLSGGESFIVSLSLALGLSELASQKIAIDSLFLDEGFGTLDEESLQMALDALALLQDGGKMVGVISHVEALKQRIPLQIKVLPRGDGTSKVLIPKI